MRSVLISVACATALGSTVQMVSAQEASDVIRKDVNVDMRSQNEAAAGPLKHSNLIRLAQAVAPTRTAAGLEEVTVTAQRREQSLQDVPISMSAFTDTTIERYDIKDAQDYLSMTPNVSYAEEGERGARSIKISIRGIGNLGGLDIGSDAVSVFYDEVNLNTISQGTANPQMHDIERVEVLRGPQGTYFGTNASGGALSIVPKKPNDTPFASVEAGVGNYGAWTAGAIINTPVRDNLFMRTVAFYEVTPGIVKNVNPVGGDSSGEYRDFRYSVRYLPIEGLTLDASLAYTNITEGIPELVATGVLPPNTIRLTPRGFTAIDDGLGFYPHNTRHVNLSVPGSGVRQSPYFDTEVTLFTGAATYDAGRFTVKAITGYVDSSSRKLYDQDRTAGNFATVNDDFDTDAWSQEVRVMSSGKNLFDWTFGGIYLSSTNSARRMVRADEDGFFPFLPGTPINRRRGVTDVESWAAFADVTWNATDTLSTSVGVRYANDKYRQKQVDTTNARPPNNIIVVPDVYGGASSDDVSPRVNVTWQPVPELTAYATASKGYRPGGVRLNPNVPPAPYEKEDLWNYELGIKGTLFQRRLQYNVSAFYMDWKNAQFESGVFLQDETGQVFSITGTQNTDAVSQGIELDFAARLTDELTFSGGAGYLDAKFQQASTARAGGVPVDLTDQALPQAPKWTLNFTADYTRPLARTGYDWFVQAEWRHRTETVANLDSYSFLANPPGTDPWPYLQKGFEVTNLRTGIDSERLSFSGFVENVFDKNYYTGTLNGLYLGGTTVRPHPRLYGVKVVYRFD